MWKITHLAQHCQAQKYKMVTQVTLNFLVATLKKLNR